MAAKLTALTDEQRALFPLVRDEWIGHGLSCEPVDRAAAVEGVGAAYRAAKLAPPAVVFIIPSPIGAVLARWMVLNQLRRAGVWDGVGAGVGDGVRAGVGAGVGDGVWDGVRDGVWAGVPWYKEIQYGQHETWLSFYDTFRRFDIPWLNEIVAPLDGLMTMAKSAGWWWLHRGFAVASDRPEYLRLERNPAWGEHGRRLHCPDGPSARWRDGWELHHWHGTLVPAWVIDNEAVTVKRILAEPNQEVRRCAIEAMGWDRFVADAGLSAVDVADDPGNPGQKIGLYDLPQQLNPYPQRVRLLLWVNGTVDRDGTRRRGGLTVPADMPDAVSAAAWTYGCDPGTYTQLERRT